MTGCSAADAEHPRRCGECPRRSGGFRRRRRRRGGSGYRVRCRLLPRPTTRTGYGMTHLGSAVHQLFARQHGVASIDQLIGAGLTHRQVEYLGHRGDLVSVIRGAYRTPSVALDELSRCAAVSLAHPLVAVSGPTAGRLWGFRRVSADRRIHVVAPRHWRATAATWCVAYRTDAIRREDVVERPDAIRVTSRARTALDLSRHLRSDDDLLSVIEQAAFDGGLRDGDLRAVAVDWAPRRPFARRFLRQLDRRLANGAAESEPEVYVGEALRQAGVEGLVRQHRIDLPGYGRGALRPCASGMSLGPGGRCLSDPCRNDRPSARRPSRRRSVSLRVDGAPNLRGGVPDGLRSCDRVRSRRSPCAPSVSRGTTTPVRRRFAPPGRGESPPLVEECRWWRRALGWCPVSGCGGAC